MAQQTADAVGKSAKEAQLEGLKAAITWAGTDNTEKFASSARFLQFYRDPKTTEPTVAIEDRAVRRRVEAMFDRLVDFEPGAFPRYVYNKWGNSPQEVLKDAQEVFETYPLK